MIVLLGSSAVKSLIPLEWGGSVGAIGRWVGWHIPSHEWDAWVCPTYHPSYISRMDDSTLEMLWRAHLEAAIKLEGQAIPGESLDVLKSEVEIVTSEREAKHRLVAASRARGWLAFDFECNTLKPDNGDARIVSVAFCNGSETWAHMMTDDLLPYLSRVVRHPHTKKMGSNIKFEERWCIAKLGHPVVNWVWDTMLAAHILDNREGGITGLKFQGYIHLGVADYNTHISPLLESVGGSRFNRIHEIPTNDLLLYNGIDSLNTYRVGMQQMKEMRV